MLWTAVDWLSFLVKPSPAVDDFEVNPPVLHNSPWQHSIVQLETRPQSLSILHAVAQKSKFSINMRTHNNLTTWELF